MTLRKIVTFAGPPLLGAIGGYAYWHFIGCTSGNCPLTSRWWTSTLYGLMIGATWLLPGKVVKGPQTASVPSRNESPGEGESGTHAGQGKESE